MNAVGTPLEEVMKQARPMPSMDQQYVDKATRVASHQAKVAQAQAQLEKEDLVKNKSKISFRLMNLILKMYKRQKISLMLFMQ